MRSKSCLVQAEAALRSKTMSKNHLPIYTVGHSTRTIPEFAHLLRAGEVAAIIDVRTVPRSRTNPQYNADVLADELSPYQIRYGRIAQLGGLRRKSNIPAEVNGFWQNQSFHNYADYALSAEFRDGLSELMELADQAPTAIMCAEAVWWRCHRRIIADYLLHESRSMFHLMGTDEVKPATMTKGVTAESDGLHYGSSDVKGSDQLRSDEPKMWLHPSAV